LAFPSTVTQNDTLSFTTKLPSEYDSWTLTYYLNNQYSVAATFTNGVFVVNSNDTDWAPGNYMVQGVATNGTDRRTVENCTVKVLVDVSTATDTASHVKKVLDAIEATILGTASREQESYEINGRSIKFRSISELVKLRDLYRREYDAELQACEIANGTFSRNIKVRF